MGAFAMKVDETLMITKEWINNTSYSDQTKVVI